MHLQPGARFHVHRAVLVIVGAVGGWSDNHAHCHKHPIGGRNRQSAGALGSCACGLMKALAGEGNPHLANQARWWRCVDRHLVVTAAWLVATLCLIELVVIVASHNGCV